MAFPTVESVATSTNDFETSHTVNLPATIDAGDLLLMLWTNDGGDTPSTPTDWTSLYKVTESGSAVTFAAFAKSADGDEDGGTVTVTTGTGEDSAARVYRITGWGGTISTDIDVATSDEGLTDAADPPNVTAGWGSADNLWFIHLATSPSDAVSSFPTNYTTNGASTGSGTASSDASVHASYRTNAASSENPGTFTLSGFNNSLVATLVIEPGVAEQTLDPPLVSVSPTFYGPTFAPGSVNLDPPLVSLTPTIYGPSLALGLSPPLVDISPSVFGPTFVPGSVNLQPPVVSISPTFYDPTFAATYNLSAPLVNIAPTLYGPSLQYSQNVTMPLIDASPTIYGPIMFKIWSDTDSLPSPTWSDVDVTP